MKKLISSLTCSILLLLLTACGNSVETLSDVNSEQESTTVSSSSDISSTSSDIIDEPIQEEVSVDKPTKERAATYDITMTVGDTVITATLDDSDTTRDFLSTLPRTIMMYRYDDREYYGMLEEISENGEAIADFENGDVTYYPAGHSFAVFFNGEERSDQSGLIRMGKITSDLSVFDTFDGIVQMQIAQVELTVS